MKDSRGFTLVEVLVALLVFSLGAAAITSAMSQVISQQIRLETKTFASWIAENEAAAIRLTDKLPNVGEKKRQVEFAGREWKVVAKTEGTPNKEIRKVIIEVYLRSDGSLEENRITDLTTYIASNK